MAAEAVGNENFFCGHEICFDTNVDLAVREGFHGMLDQGLA